MKKTEKASIIVLTALLLLMITGCSNKTNSSNNTDNQAISTENNDSTSSNTSNTNVSTTTVSGTLTSEDLFTKRDLQQTADLTEAKYYTVTDGATITITQEGVYVLSGTAENAEVIVETDDSAKVQLVLDGLTITNTDQPAIYVKNADKVFVTTVKDSTNTLTVTRSLKADGEEEINAVIYSKDDLVLNGEGTLIITSTANGVTGRDDLKVTGGSYVITASAHGLKGKDSVAIYDGNFTIKAGTDGIHSSNTEDSSKGYIYICGGTFNISAKSDGIQSITVLQIDDGNFTISAAEGLESTYVQINGGTISITASDDGINASRKSNALAVVIEINGGDITISMGQGDTDAIDANGSLYINGGTINITAQFAFDYDSVGQLNGGTVYVNGEQVTTITNSMMGNDFRGNGRNNGGSQPGNNDGGFQPGGNMPGNNGGNQPGGERDLPAQGVVVALDRRSALVVAVVQAETHVLPLGEIALIDRGLLLDGIVVGDTAHDVANLPPPFQTLQKRAGCLHKQSPF